MMVEVARFRPFYVGLFLAMALLVAAPLVAAPFCAIARGGVGVGCPLGPLLAFSAALGVAFLHEFIHYAAARLLGVRGLKLRLLGRFGALTMDYDWMTPRQYLVVALAPQLLTLVLGFVAARAVGAAGLVACVGFLANLVGGAPDIVNALYFYMAHGDADEFRLLYDENGGVAGGVVVYRGRRLVVYLF